ncbi:hypothetical protein H9P43_005422 [Blastocladiella emersonii ATCC 22665]|nr:hypothetical protein H9P43_005422 [Blastocladiella emersonii ATCC 22665]
MALAASQAAKMAAATAAALSNMTLVDEYTELLSAEVVVDVARVRDLARHHGVPDEFRGEVWRYLLGVCPADRSHEVSAARARSVAYESLCTAAAASGTAAYCAKLVRGEVNRYLRRVPEFAQLAEAVGLDAVRAVFERVIAAYLHSFASLSSVYGSAGSGSGSDLEYAPAWINVLAPLVASLREERDVYFCFEAVMRRLDAQFYSRPIGQHVVELSALLRSALPDLYNYLDEEEVDAKEWLPSWLRYGLARELPLASLLRLWDVYFAAAPTSPSSTDDGAFAGTSSSATGSSRGQARDLDGGSGDASAASGALDLHPFVCLAAMYQLKEELEELESSEILALLRRLPFKPADMDNLINHAKNLRLDAQAALARDNKGSGGGNSLGTPPSSYRTISR